MKKALKIVMALVFLTAVAALAACSTSPETQVLNPNKPAPDFLLKDLNGQLTALSNYKGQPVYFNYWATWCPSCVEEMPYIQSIYEDYAKKGLVLLTVNAGEDTATINAFLKKNNYSFPVLKDTQGEVTKKYNIYYIPVNVFVDSAGTLRSQKIGAFANKAAIEEQLKGIMK